MYEIKGTNHVNGKAATMVVETEAEAAAVVLILNSEFDSSTFTIEVKEVDDRTTS